MLKARDILDKLSKGLAFTTNKQGKIIKKIKKVKKDDIIVSRIVDGTITSKVTSVKSIR